VVTQVTLRTVTSPVYVCQKAVTSADTLESDVLTWNRDNTMSKAWWFSDAAQVHVWTAQEGRRRRGRRLPRRRQRPA